MKKSEPIKTDHPELKFQLNASTIILLLVILIPVVYTVFVNLEKPEPAPQITPLPRIITQSVNPASVIESLSNSRRLLGQSALQALARRPYLARAR